MMRKAILILALIGIASCKPGKSEAEESCESYIKQKISTPATFVRANPADHGTVMKDGKEFWVRIDYDAQNENGALTRSTYICQFPAEQGRPDTSNYVDFDQAYEGVADNLEAMVDGISNF